MSLSETVAFLIEERERINRAIEVLRGPVKPAGRPPGKRSNLSAEARARIAAAQKKRWEAFRKNTVPPADGA
jgi:hypothetical protein